MAAHQPIIPARLVIPSADFGGAFLSVFDPVSWEESGIDMALNIDADGRPVEVLDAVTAILAVSGKLARISERDGSARMYPRDPYAEPLTPERWLQLLDQSLDDLNWARVRIAQEIEAD